jgi:hypothetical protein
MAFIAVAAKPASLTVSGVFDGAPQLGGLGGVRGIVKFGRLV